MSKCSCVARYISRVIGQGQKSERPYHAASILHYVVINTTSYNINIILYNIIYILYYIFPYIFFSFIPTIPCIFIHFFLIIHILYMNFIHYSCNPLPVAHLRKCHYTRFSHFRVHIYTLDHLITRLRVANMFDIQYA